MIVFNVTEKRQKSRLLPSGFWQKSSLQNQKATFTVKFSACSSLEVTFFVLIRIPAKLEPFVTSFDRIKRPKGPEFIEKETTTTTTKVVSS